MKQASCCEGYGGTRKEVGLESFKLQILQILLDLRDKEREPADDGAEQTPGSRVRSPFAKRGQCGGCFHARGKIAYEGFHGGMPETVKAEKIHFLHGLLGRPFLKGHAISGDEYASTIVAEQAVHENFLLRILAKKRKKLHDLCIAWRRPATDGDMNEAYAQRFG